MMLNTKIVIGIYKVKSVPEGFYSFKAQDSSLSLLRGAEDSKGPEKDINICEKKVSDLTMLNVQAFKMVNSSQ